MLRVFALGGLGEIGMNCLAIEQRGEVLLVDCGVTFDNRGLGVDVVHPDFTALEPFRDRIAGVFLTHGHEDHIGALPYLLQRHDVPIWGTSYTLGLLEERREEHEILRHARLLEVRPRQKYAVGSFQVEPIRVTHSIPDATALAIKTDEGTIVHTGDFKFDEAPPDGEDFDTERLAEIGDGGVSLLLSDSTNIDVIGRAGDEVTVGKALEEHILAARGAVVVALFASNVTRLRMLGEIARKAGRFVVPLGRSIMTHAKVARRSLRTTGVGAGSAYLDWPSDLVISADRARELPKERILGIATGTQAEANAALAKLSRGEHPAIDLVKGDTVVLSSRVIPGNEPAAFAVTGDLLRRGVTVVSWYTDRAVHVSGHAGKVEQSRMLSLVRPKSFIPLHGTLHHLLRHAELARSLGVETACVLENGDVGCVENGALTKHKERVPSGRVHVYAGRAIAPRVLKERMSLAAEGMVVAVVPLNRAGRVHGDLSLLTRGVADETVDAALLATARGEARSAVGELRNADHGQIAETVRLALRRSFGKTLGYKPHVVVVVQEAKEGSWKGPPPETEAKPKLLTGPFLAKKLLELDVALGEAVPRVLDAADDEAIHDMRVAIRRLRTILKLARPIYGRFFADAVRGAFADVMRATGALRDEEVFEETLSDTHLEDAGLNAWRTRRKARERALRRAVLVRLRAGELDRARALLRALVVLPVKPSRDHSLAKFARRAVEVQRASVEDLRDTKTSDVTGLHDLRIAYKNLRYASEILTEALPQDLAAMAKPAAQFQKRLGEVHDVDVALVSIERARGLLPLSRARALEALRALRAKRTRKYEDEMRPAADAAKVTPKAAPHSGTPRSSRSSRPRAADRSTPARARSSPRDHRPRPRFRRPSACR